MIQNKTNTYNEVIETRNEPISDIQFLFNKYEEKVKELLETKEQMSDRIDDLDEKIGLLKQERRDLYSELANMANCIADFSSISRFRPTNAGLQSRLNKIHDIAKIIYDKYGCGIYGYDPVLDPEEYADKLFKYADEVLKPINEEGE